VKVGWVDRELRTDSSFGASGFDFGAGDRGSSASGATFALWGIFGFGTAPLSGHQHKYLPSVECPCTVGCLLDAGAGAMTVFVDGEPLAQQCEYTFPTDGREWAPTVGLCYDGDALFSSAV
jgi:hypothetical protein